MHECIICPYFRYLNKLLSNNKSVKMQSSANLIFYCMACQHMKLCESINWLKSTASAIDDYSKDGESRAVGFLYRFYHEPLQA